MGNKDHVAVNLKPALLQPARVEEWTRLFTEREA
jgi:hypothetical protein